MDEDGLWLGCLMYGLHVSILWDIDMVVGCKYNLVPILGLRSWVVCCCNILH